MTRKEDVVDLRADTQVHYNCAQSVMAPFAGDLGITREQAYDMMLNFGGGMGLPQEKRLELIERFRAENGAIDCATLLEAAYGRGEEKKPHCDGVVYRCVDYVCQETGLE